MSLAAHAYTCRGGLDATRAPVVVFHGSGGTGPFSDDSEVRLDGKPVLTISGRDDTRRAPDDGPRAAVQFRRLGAAVADHVLPVDHTITDADRRIAREWLSGSSLYD